MTRSLRRWRLAVLSAVGLALTTAHFSGAAQSSAPASLTVQIVAGSDRPELSPQAVEVRASWLDSAPRPGDVALSAPVTPDGKARFPELPPGHWRLNALTYDPAGYPLDVGHTEVTLQSGDFLVVALPLDYRIVDGVVTSRGRGVHGELALQPDPADGRPRLHIRLSPNGRFRTSIERPGRYTAWVFASESGIPLTQVPRVFLSSDGVVEIVLPQGRITGQVYGPDGAPRAGVRVEATFQPPADIDPEVVFLRPRSRTDTSGRFCLDALPAGEWSLAAKDGNETSRPVSVSLSPGQHSRRLALHLGPPQQ